MKRLIMLAALLLPYTSSVFASSLSDQISAVNAAKSNFTENERIKREEQLALEEARIAKERELEKQRQTEIEKERLKARTAAASAEKAKAERLAAAEAVKRQEASKDKERNQAHEDELRQLEIEEMKIRLQEKRAKAARANEYIDQDLNREKAKTDVIQSEADSTRNLSEGSKEMLKGIGTGAANGNLTKKEIINTTIEKSEKVEKTK